MPVEDLIVLDFLLQHPAVFAPFIDRGMRPESTDIVPKVSERESSEEALLRWKRAVGAAVVTPFVGRHIARGLMQRNGLGVRLTQRGDAVARRLAQVTEAAVTDRIDFVAEVFRQDPAAAHRRVREVLSERNEP